MRNPVIRRISAENTGQLGLSGFGVAGKMTGRVAVLVDGDNVAPSHAERILHHARSLGRIDVARVYAAAAGFAGWEAAAGFRLFHAGCGKNAADLLLAIDAMELALTEAPDAIVIASSDRDFTHLALRLREKGVEVAGMGEAKAPQHFRAACSSFSLLPAKPVTAAKQITQPAQVPAKAADLTDFDREVVAMLKQHGNIAAGLPLSKLGELMHVKGKTLKSRCGIAKWQTYLKSRDTSFKLVEKDGKWTVSLRLTPLSVAA